MKIFLLEQEAETREMLTPKLKKWGFELIIPKDLSDFHDSLSKQVEQRILLLGKTREKVEEIITKLRQDRQYTYIICIGFDRKDYDQIDLLRIGSDDALPSPCDLEELKYRLINARRMLNHYFPIIPGLSIAKDQGEQQTLNLCTALANFDSRKSLKKELKRLLRKSKKANSQREEVDHETWESLAGEAKEKGAEELASCSLLIASLEKSGCNCINFDFSKLYKQFELCQENLTAGIDRLEEFGFFLDKEPKNQFDPLKKARILLVEDLEYNRVLVKQILKRYRCEIVEAENGEEAIKVWESSAPFDLLLMDMNMPVMDGFKATKVIREKEKEKQLAPIPILALTALAMRGDEERCITAGCNGYTPKPVEAKHLIELCRQLLLNQERVSQPKAEIPTFQIGKTLLKTDNQIYQYILQQIFEDLEIELRFTTDPEDIIQAARSKDFDLLILDSGNDLELAYRIKDHFPLQHVILISSTIERKDSLIQRNESTITYPFYQREIEIVLHHHAIRLSKDQKAADTIAEMDSLQDMKGEFSVEECIRKSDGQLAVWQKAVRKIGGDFVLSHEFNLHGKFGFIMADVAGHDIQSGYAASWFAGLIKGLWGQYNTPVDLLTCLNNLFNHEGSEENKRFVCALVLVWDRIRHKLHYANAGIPGGLLVREDNSESELIDWRGIPIGMFPDMDMFDHGTIDFHPGDRLFMATDGVLENIPGETILSINRDNQHQKTEEVLNAVVDFVCRSIEIKDDLTISTFEGKALSEPKTGFRVTIPSTFPEADKAIQQMHDFIEKKATENFNWPMISVAIREVLINAIEHGNQKKADLPVDIDLELEKDRLYVKISDTGGGFDLSQVKKRLDQEDTLRLHGRGIELMENIAHGVRFFGGGVELEFIAETSEV